MKHIIMLLNIIVSSKLKKPNMINVPSTTCVATKNLLKQVINLIDLCFDCGKKLLNSK